MKKIRGVVLLAVIVFIIFCYLQYGRKIEVRNTRITSCRNDYSEDISITANKIWISDKAKFAEDIINTFMNNSFDNVKFSFDLGYPSELNIFVYMNNWNKNEAFAIYCLFDNNITGKLDYEFEIRE